MSLAACNQPVDRGTGLPATARRFPQLILELGVDSASLARPCPVAGGRVEQRGGPTESYEGANPSDPALCLMRFGDEPALAWFGIWHTSWPGADQAEGALGRLIQSQAGDTEGFVIRMSANLAYYDILRNEGVEDLPLLGRVCRTVRISQYHEGVPPN